jgi:hypothetical protein
LVQWYMKRKEFVVYIKFGDLKLGF